MILFSHLHDLIYAFLYGDSVWGRKNSPSASQGIRHFDSTTGGLPNPQWQDVVEGAMMTPMLTEEHAQEAVVEELDRSFNDTRGPVVRIPISECLMKMKGIGILGWGGFPKMESQTTKRTKKATINH